jgi:hypothetical protein
MARNLIIAALATLAVGAAAVGSSAPAQAGGWGPPKPMGMKPFPVSPGPFKPGPFKPGKPGFGPKYSGGYYGGAMAVGLVGGLALAAASASDEAEEDCYTVRRRMVTEDGDILIRRVRVCE